MAEIKQFIVKATNDTMTADDQSMYRALRRYYDVEMVNFSSEPGKNGPDRKIYRLTSIGCNVLTAFVERNITNVFFKPDIKQLIERSSYHD